MPAPWPLKGNWRIAWDRLGVGYWFLDGDFLPHVFYGPDAADINDEDDATHESMVTGGNDLYVGVFFNDQPQALFGYFISGNSGAWAAMEYSTDTVNGIDGVWHNVPGLGLPGARLDSAVDPEYMTSVNYLDAGIDNVKAVRWKRTGGGTFLLKAIHLYGHPASLDVPAVTDRLEIWDGRYDQRIPWNTLNLQDCPRGSSEDILFRVKNFSPEKTALEVNLTINALVEPPFSNPTIEGQFLFSIDAGDTFTATANLGSLAPGQVSIPVILRRVTPDDAALLNWVARITVSCGGDVYQTNEYVWLEDISTNVPTPHIWYLKPRRAKAGDTVKVVGMGFGEDQATYDGFVLMDDVEQTPTSWTQQDAGDWGDGSWRTISRVNDFTNTQKQEVTFEVVDGQHDGFVQIETDA